MSTYDRAQAIKVIRGQHFANAAHIFDVATDVGLPLPGACALIEMESHGRNGYGHDKGGTLSGYPRSVNEANFAVFWWLVNDQGQQSNGVGPCQLTYAGFFTDMLDKGMKPWDVDDNMRYGFGLLLGYLNDARAAKAEHIWITAGTRYNGASAYGVDLAAKVHDWTLLLAPTVVPA